MSRASAFRHEYGLIGAGAVNASLVGRIPGKALALGPVAGTSYRVASRIANTLRAGTAARSPDELDSARVILFHAPPDQMAALAALLGAAAIRWPGKSLVFCDCVDSAAARAQFRAFGASVAAIRETAIPGRLLVEGAAPALTVAHRLARRMKAAPVEIEPGTEDCFEGAITLGTGALTPLIDRAAALLRRCGLRDTEAVRLAAALFERTIREYAHSGRQSWAWHKQEPDAAQLAARFGAAGERIQAILAELVLLGFDDFEKHPAAASAVRTWLAGERER